MRILVTGATGFIGSALCAYLLKKGHTVVPLPRSQPAPREPFDAVIHLAGEPLSLSRWGQKKRHAIFSSRKEGTLRLISELSFTPKVFISASAVGFYGNRGEEILDENSSSGTGFLPEVCRAWEGAAREIERKGVKTIQARFGIVLGSQGGVLEKLIPVYKMGLGASLGDGRQWVSWVALPDLIHAIEHLLQSELAGPVNVVSPNPVRQKDFSKTLAAFLHRPAWVKAPAWALKMVLGDTADEMLLASAFARPAKLLSSGFSFRYPNLEDILRLILRR